jgi:hypothetical protein
LRNSSSSSAVIARASEFDHRAAFCSFNLSGASPTALWTCLTGALRYAQIAMNGPRDRADEL